MDRPILPALTLPQLKAAGHDFARVLSAKEIPELYGVTDGKAVGTYVEHAFNQYLLNRHAYAPGSSASGIDFPELSVDP